MGMFDEVHYVEEILQTKDLDCEMRQYFIEGGRLLKQLGDYVHVPKEERPYPNVKDGSVESFRGCIKFVKEGRMDMNFHGILHAGSKLLKFTDGNLVSVEDDPKYL